MTRPRGRPPKSISTKRLLIERSIARQLGLDPDDPRVAESLRSQRVTRDEERARRRRERAVEEEDGIAVNEWAVDAYRTYFYLLLEGDGRDAPYQPHIPLPDAVVGWPRARGHALPAELVADWAYRRRQRHERLGEIARAPWGDKFSVDPLHPVRFRKSQDGEGPTDDSVRKAIKRYELVWELAEQYFLVR